MRLFVFACAFLIVLGNAHAQTPDNETPANEGVCDGLLGGTPGLYGLCVGFCEAQDCEATFDVTTGDITFHPGCKPSSARLLAAYDKRAGDDDPPMPCVKPECPCWTLPELSDVGKGGFFHDGTPMPDQCRTTGPANGSATIINGADVDTMRNEFAMVVNGNECRYRSRTPFLNRSLEITVDEFLVCRDSIEAECALRDLALP